MMMAIAMMTRTMMMMTAMMMTMVNDDIDIRLQTNIKSSADHFSSDSHSSLGKDS